jgi:hypothetical protein
MTPEISDPNIFRCAAKKTLSIIPKHIFYASCIVDAIAAIAILYIAATLVLIPIGVTIVAAFAALLASIAWYWYALAVIPSVYYGYGLVWCIARELTDEDWKSDTAENVSAVLALVLGLVLGLVLVLGLAMALVLGLVLGPVLVLGLVLGRACLGLEYRPLLFLGAYLHYRRRTRKCPPK